MKARIVNGKDWGGNFTENHFIKYPELLKEWVLTEIIPTGLTTPEWNGTNWYEAYVELIVVPEEISRMKFEMQVLLTTGIEWDEIIAYIVALEMSQLYKKLLLIRLKRCVTLKREDTDLNVISSMMGITQQQLDEIFINGNLID